MDKEDCDEEKLEGDLEEDLLEEVVEKSARKDKKSSDEEEDAENVEFSLGRLSLGVGKKVSKPAPKQVKKKPKSLLEKLDEEEVEGVVESDEDENSSRERYEPHAWNPESDAGVRYGDKNSSEEDNSKEAYRVGEERQDNFYDDTRKEISLEDSRRGVYDEERSSGEQFYEARILEAELARKKKLKRKKKSWGHITPNEDLRDAEDNDFYNPVLS